MNELIRKLFSLFNYEPIEKNKKLETVNTQLFSSSIIQDYWLIYEGEPEELLKPPIQADLFKQCKLICESEALDKNLNLLCLWQCNSIDERKRNEAHLVEEDMYFFKKHVLQYTTEEVDGLLEEVESIGIEHVFRKLPSQPERFNTYKSLLGLSDCWEGLLYRTCIKLTFLPISTESTEELLNLGKMIEQKVDSNKLSALDEFVDGLTKENMETSDTLFSELDKEFL